MEQRKNSRDLIRQAANFGMVGAITTILTYLLYLLLLFFMPYAAAFTSSFVAGLLFALWVNAKVTFASRITAASAFYFCLFYVLSYLLGLVLIMVFVEMLHVPATLAPLAALPITVPINFLGSRFAFVR